MEPVFVRFEKLSWREYFEILLWTEPWLVESQVLGSKAKDERPNAATV
jgi:hypothetical protein